MRVLTVHGQIDHFYSPSQRSQGWSEGHLHERGDVPSICLSSFQRQGPDHATSKCCNRWLPTLCPKKIKTCRSWAKLTDSMNGIYDKTPAQQGWHDTYRLVTPSCKLVYSFIMFYNPLTIDLTSINPRFFRRLQGFPRFFQGFPRPNRAPGRDSP